MSNRPKVFVLQRSKFVGRLDSLFYYSLRLETKKAGDAYLQDMATVVRDIVNPQRLPDSDFGYVDLADVDEETGEILQVNRKKGKKISGAKNRFATLDILFARIEPSVYNKKTALVRQSVQNAVCSTEFYVIRARKGINPKFLFWMLRSDRIIAQIYGRLTGTTGRRRLDYDSLVSLLIPNPPRSVQDEIAKIMSEANERSQSKLAEASNLLKSLSDFVVQKLGISLPQLPFKTTFSINRENLEKRLDPYSYQPKYVEVIRNLEKSKYSCKSLSELADFSEETLNPKENQKDDFTYIEINSIDVELGEITKPQKLMGSDAPSRARMLVKAGDILVSTTRPYRGAIAIVPQDLDNSVASTGFVILKPKINRHFLWAILRSRVGLLQMEQRMSGGNYPAIVPDELKAIKIPVPPTHVQNEIAEEVKKTRQKVKQLRKEAREATQQAKEKVKRMLTSN